MPFGHITARLKTKYGVNVHLDTVHNFVKVRLGLYRESSPRNRSLSATAKPPAPASTSTQAKSEWDSLYSEARILTPHPKKGNS
jgi:hypothetical protein